MLLQDLYIHSYLRFLSGPSLRLLVPSLTFFCFLPSCAHFIIPLKLIQTLLLTQKKAVYLLHFSFRPWNRKDTRYLNVSGIVEQWLCMCLFTRSLFISRCSLHFKHGLLEFGYSFPFQSYTTQQLTQFTPD
jgi:hypothetical protein